LIFSARKKENNMTGCNCNLPKIMGNLIVVIGLSVLLYTFFNILGNIYALFIRPGKNLKKKYGSWGEFFVAFSIYCVLTVR
jgi:hypothetical protein